MAVKVLIVEDMATYRTIIARSLGEIKGVEVVGRASNGQKALTFLDQNEVDLITLDVEMPVMDGLSTLKEIRKRRLAADVVMLSGLSDQAAQLTIQCLELGAIDFVLKPQTSSFVENQNKLISHLTLIFQNLKHKPCFQRRPTKPTVSHPAKVVARLTLDHKKVPTHTPHTHTPHTHTPHTQPPHTQPPHTHAPVRPSFRKSKLITKKPKIVLIGISTGGPRALATVFENLNGPLPFPIVIVQHMPPKFTKSLAGSLNRKGTVKVIEAADGDLLEANKAYIAPGGYHLFMEKDDDFGMILALNKERPVNSCRPSADVLFSSAVQFYNPGEVVALVMTGMGRDGADGAQALSDAGAYVATQSEQTCTIYGMPKSIEDIGFQDEVIDLEEIAPFIGKLARRLL